MRFEISGQHFIGWSTDHMIPAKPIKIGNFHEQDFENDSTTEYYCHCYNQGRTGQSGYRARARRAPLSNRSRGPLLCVKKNISDS